MLLVLATSSAQLGAQVWSADLVYTTIEPCRIVDTRADGGEGPLVAGVTRIFNIVGTDLNSPSVQGGNEGGCAIPAFSNGAPQVQAVVIDFIAVASGGPGHLVAWPSDHKQPETSVLTYWKQASLAGFNVEHGVVLPVRQDAQGGDISVQAQVSGTGLVAGLLLSIAFDKLSTRWL